MTPEVAPARATLLQPRPWFASAKFLLLLLGLLAVYAYGWRVTKIDLPELLKGTKFVRPFVVDLVRPDVVSRDVQIQEVQLGMSVNAAVAPEERPVTETRPRSTLYVSATSSSNAARPSGVHLRA